MTIKAKAFLKKMGFTASLADAIRTARISAEMTQEGLGAKLGTSKQYICHVEAGRKALDVGQAIRFAIALGMPPEYYANLAIREELKQYNLRLKDNAIEAA